MIVTTGLPPSLVEAVRVLEHAAIRDDEAALETRPSAVGALIDVVTALKDEPQAQRRADELLDELERLVYPIRDDGSIRDGAWRVLIAVDLLDLDDASSRDVVVARLLERWSSAVDRDAFHRNAHGPRWGSRTVVTDKRVDDDAGRYATDDVPLAWVTDVSVVGPCRPGRDDDGEEPEPRSTVCVDCHHPWAAHAAHDREPGSTDGGCRAGHRERVGGCPCTEGHP